VSGQNFPAALRFDYARLDPAIAEEARACAVRIHELGAEQTEAIVAIGRELRQIKGKLRHGQFGPWLGAEFVMSAATAERYMAVAERLGDKIRTLRIFSPTILYKLSARSTPATVRDEIVRQQEAGDIIPEAEVLRRIAEAKGLQQAITGPLIETTDPPSESSEQTSGDPLTPIKQEWRNLTVRQKHEFLDWARACLEAQTNQLLEAEPQPATDDDDSEPTQRALVCNIANGCRYTGCREAGHCLHARPVADLRLFGDVA
jgi:hypothetical protein